MTSGRIKTVLAVCAALLCTASCVYVDDNLGQNFIPANQVYVVKTDTLYLDDVKMGYTDSVSAYSSSRFAVGAIRDNLYGLSTRSAAFTVVPVLDTIDLGTNTKLRQFHFTAVRDTMSYIDASQRNIVQNINVYKLDRRLDSTYMYTVDLTDDMFTGGQRITKGVPTYSGGDSLSFDFSTEFANEMIAIFKEDPDIQLDLVAYLKRMPGIYMCTDTPVAGGRINMFDCPIEVTDSYYVTGNYAELKVTADYGDRTQVDTSFLFYFGPQERTSTTEQYAFNLCMTQSPQAGLVQPTTSTNAWESSLYVATDPTKLYVEGGNGLKPVISADEIRTKLTDLFASEGISPDAVIINKATLQLQFDDSEPRDYTKNYLYPDILSPTCKFSYDIDLKREGSDETINYVSYAGLTDSSVSSENQGDVNFSLSRYAPDIGHHVQQILSASDEAIQSGRYDVWLLVMHNETVTTTDESSSELSEYYQNLAYASYYNSLYGGYGYGYGYGYNSYSSYYNNYYNYMLAAQYASASATQVQTTTVLDQNRYYRAVLKGSGADEASRPRITLIYSYIPEDL